MWKQHKWVKWWLDCKKLFLSKVMTSHNLWSAKRDLCWGWNRAHCYGWGANKCKQFTQQWIFFLSKNSWQVVKNSMKNYFHNRTDVIQDQTDRWDNMKFQFHLTHAFKFFHDDGDLAFQVSENSKHRLCQIEFHKQS